MSSKQLYLSFDVEADGPVPGPFSMLSLGAVVFNLEDESTSSFYKVLSPLPDATQDPDTMKFWQRNPKAWEAVNINQESPVEVMKAFEEWVRGLGQRPIPVAFPSGFDFTFVYWYSVVFLGKSPLGFSCLDLKSYAAAVLKTDYRKSTKRCFPQRWKQGLPKHTHLAIDDALEQAILARRILIENLDNASDKV